MYITCRKGGNQGKKETLKYEILHIRPVQAILSTASRPQQAASVTPRAEATKSQPGPTATAGSQTQASTNAEVEVTSIPSSADIELDGSFVGSTPSIIGIPGGDHVIRVKKNGHNPWERKIKTRTEKVKIAAALETDEQKTEAAAPAHTSANAPAVEETEGVTPVERQGVQHRTECGNRQSVQRPRL